MKSGKWFGIRHAVRFQLENQSYCVYPVWMTQKPRKGDYRVLKSNKILGEACPQMVACVASVSNWVIERKLERKQKKVEGGGGGEKRKRLPANPTILENASLRSKRFQSSYSRKLLRAEAKKRLKGHGEGRRGNLRSPPPPPSFIFFFALVPAF